MTDASLTVRIAFAVALCVGDDQHKSSSNQQLRRSHLMSVEW